MAISSLDILAGPKAYQLIKNNGLSPQDVKAVFGASGAAKWLAIYGLDHAIFSQWLSKTTHSIDLYGTSVGAFKLAAAAQHNPAKALDALAEAYIHQYYKGKVTADQVSKEVLRIIDAFLDEQTINEILQSPRFNFHCASVRCHGYLASGNHSKQTLAMAKAMVLSLLGKHHNQKALERTVFYTANSPHQFGGYDGFNTQLLALTAENFRPAITASGSIPVVMKGVENILAAPKGVYRDGGLLDYHPVPENVCRVEEGIVLYPHFYSFLKEAWFDKFMPWRNVKADQLDNVLLIAPSKAYVESLPGGKIPNRSDFNRFQQAPQERIKRWTIAKERSLELGEEFLRLVQSGDIAGRIKPL